LDPTIATGDDGPEGDPDSDAITNLQEYEYGLDPLTPNDDTDEDGMGDLWEITYGLSPTSSEGDDGPNGDPDGDELPNSDEYQNDTNPKNPDTDDDGMSDSWEVRWGLDPNVPAGPDGPDGDPDEDGLTNLQEFQHDTNPNSSDTDQDTLSDFWEVENNLDPNSAEGEDGADGDPDEDGSPNIEEMFAGTDPQSAASVFTVVSVNHNAPSITISWTTAENRFYRVLAADSPQGPWTAIAEGVIGTGQSETFADQEAGSNGKRFYRVEVY